MTTRIRCTLTLVMALALAGCGGSAASKSRSGGGGRQLTSQQREAETLGREVFDLVDRAMDYRGSHEGRPANNLRQMGLESLTTATVRRVENVQREPVVTVSFRQTQGREIVSCRGDRQVLEDAFLNSGRFTVMCTASSGAQRPMEVGGTSER
jgi:hypothetical protein